MEESKLKWDLKVKNISANLFYSFYPILLLTLLLLGSTRIIVGCKLRVKQQ